ncbi:MAG: glycosyltransferase family 4 protein [Acidobacteriota bacterium]
MARVLFLTSTLMMPFVAHDHQILSSAHDVRTALRSKLPKRRLWLPRVARELRRGVDLVFVWFADPWDIAWITGMAKAVGARVIVVTGGYDTTWVSAIGYGQMHNEARRRKLRHALDRADRILPFSEHAALEARALGIQTPIEVLYPGVNPDFHTPGDDDKEPLAITVGTVSRFVWKRKGLDQFARVARRVPNVRFVLVGQIAEPAVAEVLRSLSGGRLELTAERVSDEQLRGWYRRAAVYAQLSAHEGFGLALAESMACGALPVVAERGSIPEVVGPIGRRVPYADVDGAAAAVARLVHGGDAARHAARRRIVERFPLQHRHDRLLEIVDEVLQGRSRH